MKTQPQQGTEDANNHSEDDLDLCHFKAIDSSPSLWDKNPRSLT